MTDQELDALDLEVALAEEAKLTDIGWIEFKPGWPNNPSEYRPTRDSAEAMRLLVKHGLTVRPAPTPGKSGWRATRWDDGAISLNWGLTPEIAICKAIVALGTMKQAEAA